MVISKGEKDGGTILILTRERDKNARLWERMPQLDGSRSFTVSKEQDVEKPEVFDDYIERRGRQDPDCWVVELEIDGAERFIEKSPH